MSGSLTWAQARQSPCSGCAAPCCTVLPLHDFAIQRMPDLDYAFYLLNFDRIELALLSDATIAGPLEAKEVKLDAARLEELVAAEEGRMQELKVRHMWDAFEADGSRTPRPKDAALELYTSGEEVFKRMLAALEAEGDLVAAASRPKRKKKLGLKGTGMTARLGVSAMRQRVG